MKYRNLQRTARGLLTIGLVLCAPAMATAQSDANAQAYRQGYNLILDERWQQAIQVFDRMTAGGQSHEWSDDAAFWRCYARQQMGEGEAALFECYENLLERYEDSEWQDDARRALVRLAKALDRQGRSEYREKVGDYGQDAGDDQMLAILVALGEIGDERSVQVILEHLAKTKDEQTRALIVQTLEDAPSELAIQKLQDLLKNDPSDLVRIAALETLSDNDAFDASTLLLSLLKNESEPIRLRLEALDNLDHHEHPNLLDLLRELALGNNDALALEAIDEISDTESEAAVSVLVEIIAKSGDPRRRLEAVDSLEDLPYESSVAALLEIARKDPDPRMRREATESLGDMESTESRDALIQLLQEAGS